MMKVLFSILLASMFMGTKCSSQGGRQEQNWIDSLKATPVEQIDPELSGQRFDRWFADLVQPEQPRYDMDDCGERNGTPEERGKEFPMCVTVTANVPSVRKVELSFIVGTYVVPLNSAEKATEKAAKIGLFSGSLGPSDPRSKQPTRVIRKLSDLAKMLK